MCGKAQEGYTMPCYLAQGHAGPHECYLLSGPADRSPIRWEDHPPGTWTPEMKDALTEKYAAARDARTLQALADELGVNVYHLYAQAHRMGLARPIRRR